MPNQGGGEGGIVKVTGTITVDMLGTLTNASDITNYSLTFSSSGNPSTLVTKTNGEVQLFGSVTLMATSTALTGPFAVSAQPQEFNIFGTSITGSAGVELSFVDTTANPNLGDLLIANQTTSSNPRDLGSIGVASTFTIGTMPEPSSLVVMGIAGLTGLGYAIRKRRAGRPESRLTF